MFFWSKILFLVFNLSALAIPPTILEENVCERWFRAQGEVRGVLIVAHGLNLRPDRMDEMALEFSKKGYEVFRPAFHGHCGVNNNYLSVRGEDWISDAERIYGIAKKRALELHKPIYLLAYSFSALVFQIMAEPLPFYKRIYFAPPFSTHFWYRPLLWLVSFFPDKKFKSLNLEKYRFNEYGSGRSLLALDFFYKQFQGGRGTQDKTPKLIWVDKQDELVSASGLREMNFGNGKLKFLSNEHALLPKTYHHLIIDSESLGKEEWKRVIEESARFFEGEELFI